MNYEFITEMLVKHLKALIPHLFFCRKSKESEYDKAIKKDKDSSDGSPLSEAHLSRLGIEPGEVVSKAEIARRSLDSIDGIKGKLLLPSSHVKLHHCEKKTRRTSN
jgi:hypothetical protein